MGIRGKRLNNLLTKTKRLFDLGSHSEDELWTGRIYGRDRELAVVMTAQLVRYVAETLNSMENR